MKSRAFLLVFFVSFLCLVNMQSVIAGLRADHNLSTSPSDLVEPVQNALFKKGFYKGKIDGKWTPETAEAFRAFSESNGLPTAPRLTKEHIWKLWGIRFDPKTEPFEGHMAFLRLIGAIN